MDGNLSVRRQRQMGIRDRGGGALTEVQARISVRAPGGLAAYMSSVEARRREMDERRRDAEREREVCGALLCRAVLHCTV